MIVFQHLELVEFVFIDFEEKILISYILDNKSKETLRR